MTHTTSVRSHHDNPFTPEVVRSRFRVTLGLMVSLYWGLGMNQAHADKPEIMLLVDASSSMQQLQHHDAYPIGCQWARNGVDPQPAGVAVGQGFGQVGGEQRDFENLTRLHWACRCGISLEISPCAVCFSRSPSETSPCRSPPVWSLCGWPLGAASQTLPRWCRCLAKLQSQMLCSLACLPLAADYKTQRRAAPMVLQ